MRTLPKIFSPILAFSLLSMGSFAVLFSSLPAEAGFFSSILGNEVFADTDVKSGNNLQTMVLLQANVLPVLALIDKKTTDNRVNVSENVNIVSDNALLPTTGPMNVGGPDILETSSDEVSIYVVRKGDTISAVANMFGVSVDTVLAANDMKKSDKLIEGEVLLILPISGVEHTILKGETLASIAKLYKADVNDIIIYNDIAEKTILVVGTRLMIPGAEMADEGGDKPAANLGAIAIKDKNYYVTHPIQDIIGYFINPLPTGHKTQGLHGPGHRGIDIGAPKGTPIYASAGGTVLIAKTGWSGGYGNMAIIQHPNGTKTLYAHMTKLNTRTGDQITRGEIIGYVGSTGRSTGPHLHFEVFNAKNPGAAWSWAN